MCYSWTKEEDDKLIDLWIEGYTTKQISEIIKTRTYQGICGRVRKLKLSKLYPHESLIDLTGKKFGRLTVVERYKSEDKHTQWLCNCDCGKKNIVVYGQSIKSGSQVSCGCWKSEYQKNNKTYKGNKYILDGEYGIGYCSNNGKEFYFDLEDYEKIKNYTWREDANGYIVTNNYINGNGRETVLMHRLLFDLDNKSEYEVDHIKHHNYDNRKSELRVSTHIDNHRNIEPKNDYGVCGIVYDKRCDRWYSKIVVNGETIHIGTFKTIEEAKNARLIAEDKYYGEYAYSNSIKGE